MGIPPGSRFGETLRHLRKVRGETLEQVADATGLSIAMLSRIERAERLPSPDSVEALAAHFGVPADELLGEAAANRMLNRYGRAGADRAAQRIMGDTRGSGDETTLRSYGVFQARDIRALVSDSPVSEDPLEAAPRRRQRGDVDDRAVMVPSPTSVPIAPYFSSAEEAAEAIDVAAKAAHHARRSIAHALVEGDAAGQMRLIEALRLLGATAVDELRRIADCASDPQVSASAARALKILRHS